MTEHRRRISFHDKATWRTGLSLPEVTEFHCTVEPRRGSDEISVLLDESNDLDEEFSVSSCTNVRNDAIVFSRRYSLSESSEVFRDQQSDSEAYVYNHSRHTSFNADSKSISITSLNRSTLKYHDDLSRTTDYESSKFLTLPCRSRSNSFSNFFSPTSPTHVLSSKLKEVERDGALTLNRASRSRQHPLVRSPCAPSRTGQPFRESIQEEIANPSPMVLRNKPVKKSGVKLLRWWRRLSIIQ